MNESKIILIIFLIIAIVKHCEGSSIDCSISIGGFSPLICGEGNWNGFLNNTCCGSSFNGYLYALGLHANQTGQIYFDPTDEINCLSQMSNSSITNVFGCGIEKLTSGGGGCSDYTVTDVMDVLGAYVRSLTKSCEFQESSGNKSCGLCAADWVNIKELLTKNDAESADYESDVCRFAVLVSLISTRVDDHDWVQDIFQCLGDQKGVNAVDGDHNTGKKGAGSFILVGGIAGVVIVLFLSIVALMRRCYTSNLPLKQNALSSSLPKDSGDLKVPIKEVYSATNDLSEMNFIGEGTAGKVYKGKLSDGQDVAVKHIINDGFVETFLREVRSLSHVRHPNLVALLGYSENDEECFLIYELCTNGNLSEWIFGKEKALSWIQRLHVAIDSARGLSFLHTYHQGCIVHRDIKPTNILLGKNFEAKLSDFGLSKVIDLGETYVSSEVRGTFGYMDPEYQNNKQVKSAGDVYSYGIVLLQILSGRRVINMNVRKPMPIDKMAKSLTRDSSIIGFADPKLEGEYSETAFELVFKLALSCISLEQQRPSMEQVVSKLDDAIEISTRAKASTPHSTP